MAAAALSARALAGGPSLSGLAGLKGKPPPLYNPFTTKPRALWETLSRLRIPVSPPIFRTHETSSVSPLVFLRSLGRPLAPNTPHSSNGCASILICVTIQPDGPLMDRCSLSATPVGGHYPRLIGF